jgi:protein-L-isoaspartate(D-aspartate) O-methyltransferase
MREVTTETISTPARHHRDMEAQQLADGLVAELIAAGVISTPAVEAALRAIHRHLFLPAVPLEDAYANEAIPTKVLDGKAVSSASQPGIVAAMLEQLAVRPGERVLEIGAGTGYNAALLGHLVGSRGHVVSVDIDDDIVEAARGHVAAAGVSNVEVVVGDGGFGYETGAPYDRIVLTVGAADIMPAWWDQLSVGGRLLLPLSLRVVQRCVAFDKREDSMVSASVQDCGFMRLRGNFGDPAMAVSDGPVTLTFDSESDAGEIEGLFAQPEGEQELDFDIDAADCFGGVALWLALHDPHYCNIDVRGEQVPVPVARWFGSGERRIGWSPAVFDGGGLAVLGRQDDHLVVRAFGGATGCSDRLIEGVRNWIASGRPRSSSLSIRAFRSPDAVPNDVSSFRIDKMWTTLLVQWPRSG